MWAFLICDEEFEKANSRFLLGRLDQGRELKGGRGKPRELVHLDRHPRVLEVTARHLHQRKVVRRSKHEFSHSRPESASRTPGSAPVASSSVVEDADGHQPCPHGPRSKASSTAGFEDSWSRGRRSLQLRWCGGGFGSRSRVTAFSHPLYDADGTSSFHGVDDRPCCKEGNSVQLDACAGRRESSRAHQVLHQRVEDVRQLFGTCWPTPAHGYLDTIVDDAPRPR